jgi:hypothetical protein
LFQIGINARGRGLIGYGGQVHVRGFIKTDHRDGGVMTVASTAKRRRRQAVLGYRHLAHIGRGNNNRPYYYHRSKDILERREARARERLKALAARISKRRKR